MKRKRYSEEQVVSIFEEHQAGAALPVRGKSGSVRTLLACKQGYHAFFVYGFAKSARQHL